MGAIDLSRYLYPDADEGRQPQGPLKVDSSIGADFSWIAGRESIVGPRVTGQLNVKVWPSGLGVFDSYQRTVAAPIASMYTTTWTEIGEVYLDGSTPVHTLSSRACGQVVTFDPANSRIDLLCWSVADVFINGALPVGKCTYVAKRDGSSHKVWINGKLFGTASSASGVVGADGTLPAIGARAASGAYAWTFPMSQYNGITTITRTPKAIADSFCLELSSNPYLVFTPDTPQIWPSAAAGGGAQTLTPSLHTNSQTFYAPTVSLASSPQTLAPGLLTNNSTLFAPTVTPGAVTASPSLLTNTQTFYGAIVSAGGSVLQPALLSNSQSFYSATVTPGVVALTPARLDNSQTFFAPIVTMGGTVLQPPRIDNAQTFYGPALTAGAVALRPGLLTNTSTLFAPIASQGGTVVQAPLLTNAQSFFAPVVTPGGVVLQPGILINTSTLFAPRLGVPGTGIYPPAYAVLAGMAYGPNGTDYTGTLTWPTVANIAAAVWSHTQ